MSITFDRPRLEPNVTALLSRLRGRIRRYVVIEGVAATLATACALFWLCLAVDWLFEPAPAVRRGLLAFSALLTAGVFYQFVMRRLAVPLSDARLALLLERRFSFFDDSLLTAVELTQPDRALGEMTREMLENTLDEASRQADKVDVDQVFSRTPLTRAVGAAATLSTSLLLCLLVVPATLLFGVERLVGATNDPWPRSSRLLVPGFETGEKVVARGDEVELLVQADLAMPRVPEMVQVRYFTEDGARGRETMTRVGNPVVGQDAYQDFRHTFANVLSSLTLTVSGGDARVDNLKIRVVDSPTISEAVLICEYPAYMNRGPREVLVTSSVQVPVGTTITVRAKANKDLVRAQIDYPREDGSLQSEIVALPSAGDDLRTIDFRLPTFMADATLAFTLYDTDGIHNRKPFVVALSAVSDEPPQLSLQLRGIGSAITPLARLPLEGKITDDYGVASAAFQVAVDNAPPQQFPLAANVAGRSEFDVDEAYEVRDLALKPGQKLLFGAQASDAFHLVEGDQPHTASSERFQLDVVTPEGLRAMLESRELNLRQRFETIISEVIATRDSLSGTDNPPAKTTESETTAAPSPPTEGEEADKKEDANDAPLARLTVERARQNAEKNSQETAGVATAFDEIREELVNNRVDTEELRIRLKDRIADPLRAIVEQQFPDLDRRLQALHDAAPASHAASQKSALEQADALIVAMERVRDQMLELESFNEAIEMLRAIIDSEKELQEQVRQRQKQKVRDLLEDSE